MQIFSFHIFRIHSRVTKQSSRIERSLPKFSIKRTWWNVYAELEVRPEENAPSIELDLYKTNALRENLPVRAFCLKHARTLSLDIKLGFANAYLVLIPFLHHTPSCLSQRVVYVETRYLGLGSRARSIERSYQGSRRRRKRRRHKNRINNLEHWPSIEKTTPLRRLFAFYYELCRFIPSPTVIGHVFRTAKDGRTVFFPTGI